MADSSTPESTPSRVTPTVGMGENGCVAEHTPCGKCGYDVFGQAVDGSCPECGTSVRETLDVVNRLAADPSWLRTIKRGVVLTALGLGAMMVCGLIQALPPQFSKPTVGSGVCCTAAGYLLLGGLLLLTLPEPGGSERLSDIRFRERFRLCAAASLSGMPFVLLLKFAGMTNRGGCFAFCVFLAVCFVQWLVAVRMWTPAIAIARRFESRKLAQAFSALKCGVLTSMAIQFVAWAWSIDGALYGRATARVMYGYAGYVLFVGGIIAIILLLLLRSVLRDAARLVDHPPLCDTEADHTPAL